MVRAIGIDPGTKSMDVFGFDDVTDSVLIDKVILRDEVTKNPAVIMDVLRDLDADAIVGPSGYGLPVIKAKDAGVSDIEMATFITKEDYERGLKIVGLRDLMLLMRESGMNIFFTPGVIHLSTVPGYRKVNKIDMGTADKVFSTVLGIKDQAEHYGIDYRDVSFILLEIGFGYTSAIGVDEGRIVDGVGGTGGGVGYMGMGSMDSELAYALSNSIKDFSKQILFTGGAAYISGLDPLKTSPEEFITSMKSEIAYEAFMESAIKDISLLLPSVRGPREILLSGRFTRINSFLMDLESRIRGFLGDMGVEAEVRTLKRKAVNAKEGAEGASILANGIVDGKYSGLIKTMELINASGTIFDHIYLDDAIKTEIRKNFMR